MQNGLDNGFATLTKRVDQGFAAVNERIDQGLAAINERFNKLENLQNEHNSQRTREMQILEEAIKYMKERVTAMELQAKGYDDNFIMLNCKLDDQLKQFDADRSRVLAVPATQELEKWLAELKLQFRQAAQLILTKKSMTQGMDLLIVRSYHCTERIQRYLASSREFIALAKTQLLKNEKRFIQTFLEAQDPDIAHILQYHLFKKRREVTKRSKSSQPSGKGVIMQIHLNKLTAHGVIKTFQDLDIIKELEVFETRKRSQVKKPQLPRG
ncbi:uncharacterized protein BCR38DRAFT_437655 [Pseudomassariella vexata]|uniref:Uncharacterized protein n=1 Tax=Pseudomassariella vexata TaxID=1141098 RepID=A0A1Y2DU31_9PEZI|nr:uncharacterized protein BCR38DRAFT_437655 [Pseudomassariella vexata]ORY62145.1 hypothetical protein BCR38DRAFT_437655 [Pseudomassariella vexata]